MPSPNLQFNGLYCKEKINNFKIDHKVFVYKKKCPKQKTKVFLVMEVQFSPFDYSIVTPTSIEFLENLLHTL